MNKKTYNECLLDIVCLDDEDVILTSDPKEIIDDNTGAEEGY